MEQEIRFCTTPDNVRIAYATVGNGPPLVKAANWLTHLEYDWNSPVWRHWLGEIALRHTLIRYDERGCGLSDWTVEDFSFEAWVRDLETVVDELELERFPLLGISQGGAVAIEYTVRHPEKVSHLVLYGAYAQGTAKRTLSPHEVEQHKALTTLARIGWGRDNPAFRQVFSSLFMPEANPEQMAWLTELQRKTTSPENAVNFHDIFGNIDVTDLLPKLDVPTLVLHARKDARVPLEAGRQLAAGIPNARFVLLESRNHILLESEPAWQRFMDELFGFLGSKTTTSCAALPLQESPSLPEAMSRVVVGQIISHYKILQALGVGGMGLVYKALDQRLDRQVALKFLPPYLGSDESAKQRFIQEAKAASALDHPNICTIYDIGETDSGQLFIAMACYDGETLAKRISDGPLAIQEAIGYLSQIASGLGRAHSEGIVHRDVKPANIMVTADGTIKLLDFGLAKMANVNVTKTGATMGTAAYMSPEQARGEPTDHRTDLWSLGVVMHEMLTGARPFRGEYEQVVLYEIMNEEPASLTNLRPEVPETIATIVGRLLCKDPGERYRDANELISNLP